jgi:hypothetical protein
MAVSEHETGSQTATLDTEHTLNTTSPETTDGAFQLVVDVALLVNDETLTLKIKEKARSGDTQRLLWSATYKHIQARPLVASPPIILLHGWDMTLEQNGGTGRAFPWSIRKA